MEELVRSHLRQSGHGLAEVSGRAKDPDSFLKKAIRKGYADPMAQIGDKAGVRITIPFGRDRDAIERLVAEVLELSDRDDKRHDLGENKLGYLGIHFQAKLRTEFLTGDLELEGLEAELQIQTKAENAWAVAGHDSLYKAVVPPDPPTARRMMRLIGLAEIFDDEIQLFQEELESQYGFHLLQAIVPPLDRELMRLSQRKPDSGLSGLVVPPVANLYKRKPEEIYPHVLAPYIDKRRPEFEALYARYEGDARANPLMFQPEAFMLFERIEKDRFRLAECWPAELPLDLLDNLGSIRGTPLK